MVRSVFIVDEDFDCRTALGEVLEEMGLLPVLFRDPGEALAALAPIPPAVLLTELWRAGTPAGARFHALLALAKHAALPVVVFSAWTRTEAEPRLPFQFVPKPEVKLLLKTIRALVPEPSRDVGTPGRASPEAAIGAT